MAAAAAPVTAVLFTNERRDKFAWLGGNKNMGRQIERFEGVEDALRERNLSINPKHIARSEGGDRMEGYKAAKHIVEGSKNDLPTAWICLNGLMARGAINFLFQNGYKVRQDVRLKK